MDELYKETEEPFAETKKQTYAELRKSLEARIAQVLKDPYYLATRLYYIMAVLDINDRLERRQYNAEVASPNEVMVRNITAEKTK